jgi:hypothetical protein
MVDVFFPGNSNESDGLGLLALGLIIFAWGFGWFSSSVRSSLQPFNQTSKDISIYSLVLSIVVVAVSVAICFTGFNSFTDWLAAKHTTLDEPEIPMQFLGMTLRFSNEHYLEAFDIGDLVSYEFAILTGIGIFIALGSTWAIIIRDFDVVPMYIHFLDVIYGVVMALIFTFMLYSWLNAILGELYTLPPPL